jgi:phenylacetate-coenzyme A ligase PaaK-like adenylate-forming protein
MESPQRRSDGGASIREALLHQTITYAIDKVPFYAEFRGRKGVELAELPIVDADLISNDLYQFTVLTRFPDFFLQSGGTTGGAPSIIIRNLDEFEISYFDKTGLEPRQYFDPHQFETFVLNLVDLNHGLSFQPPHGQPVINVPIEHGGNLEVIVRLLDRGMVIAGCQKHVSQLVGSITKLKVLTAHLQRLGRSPKRDWAIKCITTYGFHTSRYWQSLLESFWGAKVDAIYGLTEFNTAFARQCRGCSGFVLPDTVYPEFLRPDNRAPVQSGDAILVLTSLYPFVQVMPRIRYWTGDLVTVGRRHCTVCNSSSFRFRGRANYSLVACNHADCEALISPVDLVEVADELADVAVDDTFQQILYHRDPSPSDNTPPVGYPAINIEVEKSGENDAILRLRIETIFDPISDPGRAALLRRNFIDLLNSNRANLEQEMRMAQARLEIELLPPGGLRAQGRFATPC